METVLRLLNETQTGLLETMGGVSAIATSTVAPAAVATVAAAAATAAAEPMSVADTSKFIDFI